MSETENSVKKENVKASLFKIRGVDFISARLSTSKARRWRLGHDFGSWGRRSWSTWTVKYVSFEDENIITRPKEWTYRGVCEAQVESMRDDTMRAMMMRK